mgnify:CR=1 FL=1
MDIREQKYKTVVTKLKNGRLLITLVERKEVAKE